MIKSGVIGGAFGLVLLVLAAYLAGGGHGLYFPLGVAAAPLSLLGIIPAFVGLVPLWATLGALSGTGRFRQWLRVGLVVQIAAAVVVVLVGPFADFRYFSGSRLFLLPWVAAILVLYLAAQVMLWMRLRRTRG